MHQSKLLLQLETKNSRDLPATTLGWCSTSEVNIRTRSSNTSVPSNFTDNRTLSAERATLSATLAVFICCWENFVRRCPITGKHWRSANVLVSSLLPVMILATLRYALPVSEMSMPLSKTSTAPPRLREKQGWHKEKGTTMVGLGRYDVALWEYAAAEKVYERSGLQRELVEALNDTATVYESLG